MKYSLKYNTMSRFKDDADELVVKYENGEFKDFMKEHSHQRIVFIVDDIEFFFATGGDARLSVYPNSLIRIEKDDYEFFMEKQSKSNFPVKFLINHWCMSIDEVYDILNTDTKDVYISGSLAFDLDRVCKIIHDEDRNVRIIPHIVQGIYNNNLSNFWIRPDDIDLYDKYVDYCEITSRRYKISDMYYNVYKNDKSWFGDLNEIIIGLGNFNNKAILPLFGAQRLNCKRRCVYEDGCRLCYTYTNLARDMEDENYVVMRSK